MEFNGVFTWMYRLMHIRTLQSYMTEIVKDTFEIRMKVRELEAKIKKLEKWSHPDREKEFKKVIKDIEKRLDDLEQE